MAGEGERASKVELGCAYGDGAVTLFCVWSLLYGLVDVELLF